MSLIVEFLGNMTKCLNSKKVLRANCMSSNSDSSNSSASINNISSANKIAIRNRLKMEKKLERLSNLTKKLLDDLDDQEDINNNTNDCESINNDLYVHNNKLQHNHHHHQHHRHQDHEQKQHHHQDTDEENEAMKLVSHREPGMNLDINCLKECVVCLACPARIETMPCRHAVLCKRCFLRTIQTVIAQGTATLKCVLCRTKVVAINELELNPRRMGDKQPARSTDPIKPKFNKIHGDFPPAPCRSAISLFRRSSKVQDINNRSSSPTQTFHSACIHPTRVTRKQDKTYHLLSSHSNTFGDQMT